MTAAKGITRATSSPIATAAIAKPAPAAMPIDAGVMSAFATITPVKPATGSTYVPSTGNAVGSATPPAYVPVGSISAPSVSAAPITAKAGANRQDVPMTLTPISQVPVASSPAAQPSYVPGPQANPVIPGTSSTYALPPAAYSPPASSASAPAAAPPPAAGAPDAPAPASPLPPDPAPPDPAAASPLAVPPAAPISTPATATAAIVVAPAPATVAPSVWTRILRFFGFSKAPAAPAPTVSAHGEPMRGAQTQTPQTQEQVAVALVRRARAGDQNAMATLDLIGKNARAGNARAQKSFDLCMAYARANPPQASGIRAGIYGEGGSWAPDDGTWDDSHDDGVMLPEGAKSDPLFADAVYLSHGPLLTDDAIIGYAARFGNEEMYAFSEGMRQAAPLPGHPSDRVVATSREGAVMGIARRIQQVRQPGANLGHYDPRIAAEIGT